MDTTRTVHMHHSDNHSFDMTILTILFIITTTRHLLFLFSSNLGRLARGSPLGNERTSSFSLFCQPLSNKLLVGSSLFLVTKNAVELFSLASTLALKSQGSHQTLNLGSLAYVLPFLLVKVREMTYLRTSSSLVKLKSLRMLLARLGPRRRGTVSSVRPGMGLSGT